MNEPEIYFFDCIDRNAIVIKPKKPFFEWLNNIEPEGSTFTVDEANIYLVRERDSNDQIERWLSRNFDRIFQNELNGWYLDQSLWPQKRTYKIFKEWFDFEIHSMILDIENTAVSKL